MRCYHARLEWTWELWQWRGTPHSSKSQHHWNLTIRLFSVISRTLIEGGLTPLQRCSRCILQPQLTGQPGDQGSIPGRVIPKTQKWYLMLPYLTLSIIRYESRSNPRNGVVASPTLWCSSYWKGSLQNLNYGCQLYLLYILRDLNFIILYIMRFKFNSSLWTKFAMFVLWFTIVICQ